MMRQLCVNDPKIPLEKKLPSVSSLQHTASLKLTANILEHLQAFYELCNYKLYCYSQDLLPRSLYSTVFQLLLVAVKSAFYHRVMA